MSGRVAGRLLSAIYEAESPLTVYVRRYALRQRNAETFYFHSHRGAHGMDPADVYAIDRWLLLEAPGSQPCRRCFGEAEVVRWINARDAIQMSA